MLSLKTNPVDKTVVALLLGTIIASLVVFGGSYFASFVANGVVIDYDKIYDAETQAECVTAGGEWSGGSELDEFSSFYGYCDLPMSNYEIQELITTYGSMLFAILLIVLALVMIPNRTVASALFFGGMLILMFVALSQVYYNLILFAAILILEIILLSWLALKKES